MEETIVEKGTEAFVFDVDSFWQQLLSVPNHWQAQGKRTRWRYILT
jgi:hypothetical protein